MFDRISRNPEIMAGKACIKGTRVTVSAILANMAEGRTHNQILADYPYLTTEDLQAATRYAAWLAQEREVEFSRA